jgi:hypothetical protein
MMVGNMVFYLCYVCKSGFDIKLSVHKTTLSYIGQFKRFSDTMKTNKLYNGLAKWTVAILALFTFPLTTITAQVTPPVPSIEALKAPYIVTPSITAYNAFSVTLSTDPSDEEYGEKVTFGFSGSATDAYTFTSVEDFPFINAFPGYTDGKLIKIKRKAGTTGLTFFTDFLRDFRAAQNEIFEFSLGASVTTVTIGGTLTDAGDIVSIYTDLNDKTGTLLWESLNGSASDRGPGAGATFNATGHTTIYVEIINLEDLSPRIPTLVTTAEAGDLDDAADGNDNNDADDNDDGVDDQGYGVTYREGWNMVSIPVTSSGGNTVQNIFGVALINNSTFAFEWNNAGTGPSSGDYVNVSTLTPGKGYWIFVDTDLSATANKTTRYFGDVASNTPVFSATSPSTVDGEYVMIGATAANTIIPKANIASDAIWSYVDGAYSSFATNGGAGTIEDDGTNYVLRPGRAYWVNKTTGAGTLSLEADIFGEYGTRLGSNVPKITRRVIGDEIVVNHGAGRNLQHLYFNADNDALTPPFPPNSFQSTIDGKNLIASANSGEIVIREATEDILLEFTPVDSKSVLVWTVDGVSSILRNGEKASIKKLGNFSIKVEIVKEIEDEVLPTALELDQNYPNPFNPTTAISYSLNEAMPVQLSVFNMNGQKVATLVNSTQNAGSYNVNFNASNLASGLYIYRLTTPMGSITRKMTLMK